jgi:hypothetical protein
MLKYPYQEFEDDGSGKTVLNPPKENADLIDLSN